MKPFNEALEEFRREYVRQAMRIAGGNIAGAAKIAGWSRGRMRIEVVKILDGWSSRRMRRQ